MVCHNGCRGMDSVCGSFKLFVPWIGQGNSNATDSYGSLLGGTCATGDSRIEQEQPQDTAARAETPRKPGGYHTNAR